MKEWTRLLDDIFAGARAPQVPWMPQPIPANWRTRFGTARWNLFTAATALNVEIVDDPALLIGDNDMSAELLGHSADRIALTAQGCSTMHGGNRRLWVRRDTPFPIRTSAHELAHVIAEHELKISGLVFGMLPDAVKADFDRSVVQTCGGAKAMRAFVTRHAAIMRLLTKLAYGYGEVEAEGTALLVSHALGYPDGTAVVPTSYDYLRHYLPPDTSADMQARMRENIVTLADSVLDAGGATPPAMAA